MTDTNNSATKVWLITGSTRGLGRALAEAVLAAGHKLVATGRDPGQLKDLVARYGDQVRAITLDVTSEQAATDAVAEAIKAFGRLDVVANNAGYGDVCPIEDTEHGRVPSTNRNKPLWRRSCHQGGPSVYAGARKWSHSSILLGRRSNRPNWTWSLCCREVGSGRVLGSSIERGRPLGVR